LGTSRAIVCIAVRADNDGKPNFCIANDDINYMLKGQLDPTTAPDDPSQLLHRHFAADPWSGITLKLEQTSCSPFDLSDRHSEGVWKHECR
jgi:hypothetical protein